MTVEETYRQTLAQIEELQAVLQRMLGRADTLAELMSAGHAAVEVGVPPDHAQNGATEPPEALPQPIRPMTPPPVPTSAQRPSATWTEE